AMGIFTLYTSDTCKRPPPEVVRRPRIGPELSSRIPGRDVRRTGVASPKRRASVSRPHERERVTGARRPGSGRPGSGPDNYYNLFKSAQSYMAVDYQSLRERGPG